MLKKIAKFFIYLLLLIGLGIAAFYITLAYQLPLYDAVVIFFGFILGLWLLRTIIRWVYRVHQTGLVRRRSKDVPTSGQMKLKKHWKQGLATLKRSGLRNHGNPLYVLPWALVIGDEQSGKTATIVRSRVNSAIHDLNPKEDIAPTVDCDWWYLDQEVVLDTSADLLGLASDNMDRSTWQQFVHLLAHTRRKEPLNALIITLSVNKILLDSPEQISDFANHLRQRVNLLTARLGYCMPVYLVVTKCDQIHGFSRLAETIPTEFKLQAMGYVEQKDDHEPEQILQDGFQYVTERLHKLRTLLAREHVVLDAELLLLIREFSRLETGLARFVSIFFREEAYSDQPYFRGLFFTSTEHKTAEIPSILSAYQVPEIPPKTPRVESLFIRDIFSKVIPADRYHYREATQTIVRRKRKRNALLTGWYALSLLICILLGYAYSNSVQQLRYLTENMPKHNTVTSASLPQSLILAMEIQQLIKQAKQLEGQWTTRILPFHGGINDIIQHMDADFSQLFEQSVLPELDQQMQIQLQKYGNKMPPAMHAAYVENIVRRINLTDAVLEEQDSSYIKSLPKPQLTGLGIPGMTPEISQYYQQLYPEYLLRTRNDTALRKEKGKLQNWLLQYQLLDNQLAWLLAYANTHSAGSPVTLYQFWHGSGHVAKAPEIPPAFTSEGEKTIAEFVQEIETATPEPLQFKTTWSALKMSYAAAWLSEWTQFALEFPKGKQILANRAEWIAAANTMDTGHNPYFSLLGRIEEEILNSEQYIEQHAYDPEFTQLVQQFAELLAYEQAGNVVRKASSAKQDVDDFFKKLTQPIDKVNSGTTIKEGITPLGDNMSAAANMFIKYVGSLTAINKLDLVSQSNSFKAAQGLYGGSGSGSSSSQGGSSSSSSSSGTSPFIQANAQFQQLRNYMTGGIGQQNVAFWGLLEGPLDFYTDLVTIDSACVLNDDWQSQVVKGVQGASGEVLTNLLYGKSGLIWEFVDKDANDFIQLSGKGYEPKRALGYYVPLNNDFFNLLDVGLEIQAFQRQLASQNKPASGSTSSSSSSAASGSSSSQTSSATQKVTIQALPTNVNHGAKELPTVTKLIVQCAKQVYQLENYNFPTDMTVEWTFDTCGTTQLQIEFPDFTAIKTYASETGFNDFLLAFRDGEATFTQQDFPQQKSTMDAFDVTSIQVRYQISGMGPILQELDKQAKIKATVAKQQQAYLVDGLVPSVIAQCQFTPASAPQLQSSRTRSGTATPPTAQAAPKKTVKPTPKPAAKTTTSKSNTVLDKFGKPYQQSTTIPPLHKPPTPDFKRSNTSTASASTVTTKSGQATSKTGQWMIQVGTFKSAQGASGLTARLQKAGYPAYTASCHRAQTAYTCVYVGPVSYNQAKQDVQKIKTEFGVTGFIAKP